MFLKSNRHKMQKKYYNNKKKKAFHDIVNFYCYTSKTYCNEVKRINKEVLKLETDNNNLFNGVYLKAKYNYLFRQNCYAISIHYINKKCYKKCHDPIKAYFLQQDFSVYGNPPKKFRKRTIINTYITQRKKHLKYNNYHRIHSCQSMNFKNEDIIITDPCYVFNYHEETPYEVEKLLDYYSEKESSLGMCDSTYYGDWSATVFNMNTAVHSNLGDLCADSGQCCVLKISEVKKYNNKLDSINKWCATIIKNFTGTIKMIPPGNKDNKDQNNSLVIVGKGNINFEVRQTGF